MKEKNIPQNNTVVVLMAVSVKSSIRAQAYVKQALMHFESLRLLDISERDNVNAFTVLHYKVCFSIANDN